MPSQGTINWWNGMIRRRMIPDLFYSRIYGSSAFRKKKKNERVRVSRYSGDGDYVSRPIRIHTRPHVLNHDILCPVSEVSGSTKGSRAMATWYLFSFSFSFFFSFRFLFMVGKLPCTLLEACRTSTTCLTGRTASLLPSFRRDSWPMLNKG